MAADRRDPIVARLRFPVRKVVLSHGDCRGGWAAEERLLCRDPFDRCFETTADLTQSNGFLFCADILQVLEARSAFLRLHFAPCAARYGQAVAAGSTSPAGRAGAS